MNVLVQNCFHWIGFHLVNTLLEGGYQVAGADIISSEKKAHLSMFFGRNDLFSLVSNGDVRAHDVAIVIGDDVEYQTPDGVPIIQLFRRKPKTSGPAVFVKLPLLFGEWMPITEEGVYEDEEWISFHSDRFIHGAVYIGDFMQEFLQWLEKKGSTELKIYENKEIELVNSSYIHNNRTIKEKKANVIRHYQQFHMFY